MNGLCWGKIAIMTVEAEISIRPPPIWQDQSAIGTGNA